MQFRPLRSVRGTQRSAGPLATPAGTPPTPSSDVNTTFQNLLAHIPGEASGFYLFGMELLQKSSAAAPDGGPVTVALPNKTDALIVAALSLGLLVLFRKLSGSTWTLILTSIGAFVIWMAAFNLGALNIAGWGIREPLGLIVAAAYSIAITALANKGILK